MPEFQRHIGGITDIASTIDVSKLPFLIRNILTNFLQPLCPGVPLESLLLDLNVKLAQMVSHNRMKIQLDEGNLIPVNYYGVIFMPSGSGKDKPLKLIDKYLLKTFEEKFDIQAKRYKESALKKVEEEAEEKFSSSGAGKEKYIHEHRPRRLVKDIGDGTLEGFIALREAFADAGFGATFMQISEFGDFIMSNNTARGEMLSLFMDVYDVGDNKPKIIKGDKDVGAVKDVPSNGLFHTSLSGLYSAEGREKLLTFFNRGLARRCFICYPSIDTGFDSSQDLLGVVQSRKDIKKQALAKAAAYEDQIDKVFEKLSKKYTAIEYSLSLNNEAETKLEVYKLYNEYRASHMSTYDEREGLRAEIKTRDWKTLKLAGLIAVIEHPDELVITGKDVEYAIYQTEVFGLHLRKFYDNEQISEAHKLFYYFKENVNVWIKKSDLRGKSFVGKNNFAKWFEENFDEFRDLLVLQGYKLEIERFGSNGVRYRLVNP